MKGVTVVIDPRFNGPPGSGHGGYSAGCAAAQLHAPAVEVTLRRPPPLGVPMDVRRTGDGVDLLDGDELVASARPVELEVAGPPPVSAGQADSASDRFAWAEDHPFPTCFGCGPEREPDDALCLYTGPVGDGRFAVPWTPPEWSGNELVDPLMVWAALDCPSSAPVHPTIDAPVVLGRLSVALERPVAVGAPHVIQSWLEHMEGRKRSTAVELYDGAGERLAYGRAVWIELATAG